MAENNNFILTWIIKNCSKLNLKFNDCLESPPFLTEHGTKKWTVKFYPTGNYSSRKFPTSIAPQHEDNPYLVCCTLCRTGGFAALNVDFSFQFSDSDEVVFYSGPSEKQTFHPNFRSPQYMMSVKDLNFSLKTSAADILTIRCFITIKSDIQNIKKQHNILENSRNMKILSEIGMNKSSFLWSVRGPSSSHWIEKKLFSCTETTSLEVTLTAPADEVVIYIKNISKHSIGFQSVTAKISLVDETNCEIHSRKSTHVFDRDGNSVWKFPAAMPKSAIQIKNGLSTFLLKFMVRNGIITHCVEQNSESVIKPKQNVDAVITLQHDLQQLLYDKKFSDVILKVGGELFHAHKCLLSSRSPVFRAMFDSDMLESQTNTVEINDVDSATLDRLMKFLYTGYLDVCDSDNNLKLLIAADYYQVESLCQKCEEVLMNLIDEENVLDVIATADVVRLYDLKASAFEFIKKHATAILSSAIWAEWSKQNIHLACEISSKLALELALKTD